MQINLQFSEREYLRGKASEINIFREIVAECPQIFNFRFVSVCQRTLFRPLGAPSSQKTTLWPSLGAPSGRANDFFAGTRPTEWSSPKLREHHSAHRVVVPETLFQYSAHRVVLFTFSPCLIAYSYVLCVRSANCWIPGRIVRAGLNLTVEA